jgi:hypothetical protein
MEPEKVKEYVPPNLKFNFHSSDCSLYLPNFSHLGFDLTSECCFLLAMLIFRPYQVGYANLSSLPGWQLGPLKKLKINMHWLVGARVKYVDEGLIFLRL